MFAARSIRTRLYAAAGAGALLSAGALIAALLQLQSVSGQFKTFINASQYDEKTLIFQTVIHFTFLLSALAIAATDLIMEKSIVLARTHAGDPH